jgi:hypothetical protein
MKTRDNPVTVMKFVSDVRLLLLSVWLGAAVFFIAVAQSAFAVLPQRELAGAVVNRTLSVLNFGGMAIALVLILTSFLFVRNANRVAVWAERFLLLIHFEHVRRLQSTRQSMSRRSTQTSSGSRLPFRHHSVGPKIPTIGVPAEIAR